MFLQRIVPRNLRFLELLLGVFVIVARSRVTLYFERRCMRSAVLMAGCAKHGLNFRNAEWVSFEWVELRELVGTEVGVEC